MSVFDLAKRDWADQISNTDGFAIPITFTTPNGGTTAQINGLHTKHHLSYDAEGLPVNTKNAHISFREKDLTDLSYPVRDANGEVYLYGHKIEVKDSTGSSKTYMITETFPDETVGVIVCILGDRSA